MADKKQNEIKFGEVIAKCWEDEAYKKRFLEDPEVVLGEAGFVLEEGVTYKVIEQPKMVEYLVLPYEEAKEAVQFLAKRILNKAEKTTTIIPEGSEIRIIQNTEDIRYLVLPVSPKSLTKAELAAVTGGAEGDETTYTTACQTLELATTEVQTAETTTTFVAECEVAVVVGGVLI